VKLAELEVGKVGPGCGREDGAGSDRAPPHGFVVRRQSAAPPPVARTLAGAATDPESVSTPWQRSPSLHIATTEVRSRTSIRRSAETIAASFEVISWPVWLPPAWTMRRRV
jgi:hypothetical protein